MSAAGDGSLNVADRIQKLLFHLGKALWKSVPVVGPFVEELVYAQFESVLLPQVRQKMGTLTLVQLDELLASLPSEEQIEVLEMKLAEAGWDQRLQIAKSHADLMLAVSGGFKGMTTEVHRMKVTSRRSGENLVADDEARRMLSEAEQKRRGWVRRISMSQRQLLDQVTHDPTDAGLLWERVKGAALPESTELEFRFRLHELEWLGLVDRRRNDAGEWEYWRVIAP